MNFTLTPQSLHPEAALSLLETIIQQSTAEGVVLNLQARESALSRFSENQLSQNIQKNTLNLTVTSYWGRRSASASTTELDEESIRETLQRSENLARLAPEDPEWVPLLEPQTYSQRQPGFAPSTANFSPVARGKIIQQISAQAQKAGVESSGTLSTNVSLEAIANSRGLRAAAKTTTADFSITARIEDGSSWGPCTAIDIEELPFSHLTEQVITQALASRNPRPIEPGTYPVILQPSAFASLLPWVVSGLNARSADEGRSFMSRFNEQGEVIGNRLGEQLFSPLVEIYRQPSHPSLQAPNFGSDGLPNQDLTLVAGGVPQTLSYSRYWAEKQGTKPNGNFYPIFMPGSAKTLLELIADTERAILITRAWYVRYVNPRTLEVTGMTRDGTFWVENGKIAYPIKNLRFNQSLPELLAQIEALSQVQRVGGLVVPGVKVKAFGFSSVTDSV